MFGQTYITLNAPSGRGAEVNIPSSPQRPFITTKELGLLTLELAALSSTLLGCAGIQQPTQPLPSTETPMLPTQTQETTLPTQTPPPPTSIPPLPTATSPEKLPIATSTEEQPPTLETCKTTAEEVLAKYPTGEKTNETQQEIINEMQEIANNMGDSIDDYRHKTHKGEGFVYALPTDGLYIEDPYCVPGADGTTIGVARFSMLVYFNVDGKVTRKLVPILIDVGDAGVIFWGSIMEGAGEQFIQERIAGIPNAMRDTFGWELGSRLTLIMPRNVDEFYDTTRDTDDKVSTSIHGKIYYSYYGDRADRILRDGDISELTILLPISSEGNY